MSTDNTKKTKQKDATKQRLESLKAQNEAAKIALKQRELDIAEREQEFVEPSEFQRAKILTEMLPSRGGSSLGAQAIRMPMSRPKPIYSPNALRTPIASPQEEIEAKHLDMLDELDQVDQEKIQSLRSKYDYINEMAVRAQKLGFDITGGIGYDPSNEAHREIHEEYVRLRGQAIDEGRRLQELRKSRESLAEAYNAKDYRNKVDLASLGTSEEIYQVRGQLTPDALNAIAVEWNKRAGTVSTFKDYELFEQDRKAVIDDLERRAKEMDSVNPYEAQRLRDSAASLKRIARNLDWEKLQQRKAEQADKKRAAEAKGDKDAMNVNEIVDPFAKLAKGFGGVETGIDGKTEWSDFNGGFLNKVNKINKVIRNKDGSITVKLSGASSEKDVDGKVKGWQPIADENFPNAYAFFKAWMGDKNNELDVDRVEFFNKFDELGYGGKGSFNFGNIFGEDLPAFEKTRVEQTAHSEDMQQGRKNLQDHIMNKIKKGKDFTIGDLKFEKETLSPWLGEDEWVIKNKDGSVVEIKKEDGSKVLAENYKESELKKLVEKEIPNMIWSGDDPKPFKEHGKDYVDKYQRGSKSKTTKKEDKEKNTTEKEESKETVKADEDLVKENKAEYDALEKTAGKSISMRDKIQIEQAYRKYKGKYTRKQIYDKFKIDANK